MRRRSPSVVSVFCAVILPLHSSRRSNGTSGRVRSDGARHRPQSHDLRGQVIPARQTAGRGRCRAAAVRVGFFFFTLPFRQSFLDASFGHLCKRTECEPCRPRCEDL